MENEKYFQNKLCKLFRKKRFDVFEEVPYKRKRIDIVHYENEKITCVEVKLENWRRAIDQASENNLFCDHSYIALPEQKISNVDHNLLKKLNIGLISIKNNSFEIKTPPERNRFKIDKYYQRFKNTIVKNYES